MQEKDEEEEDAVGWRIGWSRIGGSGDGDGAGMR